MIIGQNHQTVDDLYNCVCIAYYHARGTAYIAVNPGAGGSDFSFSHEASVLEGFVDNIRRGHVQVRFNRLEAVPPTRPASPLSVNTSVAQASQSRPEPDSDSNDRKRRFAATLKPSLLVSTDNAAFKVAKSTA